MMGTLYRGCAIVDHAIRSLALDMAVLVATGGTTAVAGRVDAHSYLTVPGGPTGSVGPPTRCGEPWWTSCSRLAAATCTTSSTSCSGSIRRRRDGPTAL